MSEEPQHADTCDQPQSRSCNAAPRVGVRGSSRQWSSHSDGEEVTARIPMRDLARLLDLVLAATIGEFDQEQISKAIDITGRYGFDLTVFKAPNWVRPVKEVDRLCTKYGYPLDSEFAEDLDTLCRRIVGYHGNQSLSEASPTTQSEAQEKNTDKSVPTNDL